MSQTDQDRRIDYIELPTTDIEEMKRFYTDTFGWPFTDHGPDYAPGGRRFRFTGPSGNELAVWSDR